MTLEDFWTVRFSGKTLEEIKRKASERMATKHYGRPVSLMGGQGKFDTDLAGMLAEYAFAHFYGVPYSEIRTDTPRGDGDVDFTIDNTTFQVKGALNPRAKWALTAKDTKMPADWIVAARCLKEKDGVVFLGAAPQRDWNDRVRVFELTGQGYGVPYSEFKPMHAMRLVLKRFQSTS